jgi:hypothetical protein
MCTKFQCHDPEDSGPARRVTTSRSNSSEADRRKDVINHEPRGLSFSPHSWQGRTMKVADAKGFEPATSASGGDGAKSRKQGYPAFSRAKWIGRSAERRSKTRQSAAKPGTVPGSFGRRSTGARAPARHQGGVSRPESAPRLSYPRLSRATQTSRNHLQTSNMIGTYAHRRVYGSSLHIIRFHIVKAPSGHRQEPPISRSRPQRVIEELR